MSHAHTKMKTKNWAFWALSSLLFNIFTPFITYYSHAETFSTTPIVQGKALLCTAQGLKWVDVADYSGTKGESQASGQHHCPFCLHADHHSDALGQLSNNHAGVSFYHGQAPQDFGAFTPLRKHIQAASARAPPLA